MLSDDQHGLLGYGEMDCHTHTHTPLHPQRGCERWWRLSVAHVRDAKRRMQDEVEHRRWLHGNTQQPHPNPCQGKPDYILDKEKILSPQLKRPSEDLCNSPPLLSLAPPSRCTTISTSSHMSHIWDLPATFFFPLAAEKQKRFTASVTMSAQGKWKSFRSSLFKCKW